jgi:hypothetical protein
MFQEVIRRMEKIYAVELNTLFCNSVNTKLQGIEKNCYIPQTRTVVVY